MTRLLEALSSGEKMLNQRFLSESCMSEKRAEKIWNELAAQGKMEDGGGRSLAESLVRCNAHLELASLEIVGLVFPHPTNQSKNNTHDEDEDDDNEDDENQEPTTSQSHSSQSKKSTTKYMAMIHKYTPVPGEDSSFESAAKLAFKSTLGGNVGIRHRRTILAYLAEHTTAPRSTLINLKNESLKGEATSSNYTLEQAEGCVDSMLQDHWIVAVGGGKHRRVSMQSHLALGPRTYMELSDVLTEELGMDPAQLPQQLYFR